MKDLWWLMLVGPKVSSADIYLIHEQNCLLYPIIYRNDIPILALPNFQVSQTITSSAPAMRCCCHPGSFDADRPHDSSLCGLTACQQFGRGHTSGQRNWWAHVQPERFLWKSLRLAKSLIYLWFFFLDMLGSGIAMRMFIVMIILFELLLLCYMSYMCIYCHWLCIANGWSFTSSFRRVRPPCAASKKVTPSPGRKSRHTSPDLGILAA